MRLLIVSLMLLAPLAAFADALSVESGKTYSATWPVRQFKVAEHHAYRIEWTNLRHYPKMRVGDLVTFKVEKIKITAAGPKQWLDTYQLRILKVISKSPPEKPKTKAKKR